MKKIIVFCIFGLLITGCGNSKKIEPKVLMYCNDVKTELELKEKDIVSCKLLGENYNFKIIDITEDKIEIESNEYGLTSDNNLREKNKRFIINRNDTLRLATQSTDYQESVIFKWKE